MSKPRTDELVMDETESDSTLLLLLLSLSSHMKSLHSVDLKNLGNASSLISSITNDIQSSKNSLGHRSTVHSSYVNMMAILTTCDKFSSCLPLTVIKQLMISFALFLKMANGATYAITPFVNEKNVGLVSGIVGAGGNVGGMLFGFLFKSKSITYTDAFGYIGMIAIAVSLLVLVTRFTKKEKVAELNVALENAA